MNDKPNGPPGPSPDDAIFTRKRKAARKLAAEVAQNALLNPNRKPARKIPSALLPEELGSKSPKKLSIAVVGTCVAELLANTCDPRSWRIDHFLMHILRGPFAPDVPLEEYDAIVVQITLRQ